jgi:hypothetical protein
MASYFAAGGWGMYLVVTFGFLAVAASVFYALRPERRTLRLALATGALTLASGLLGTFTGFCETFRYLAKVPVEKQFQIAALGCEESLHNAVLALVLLVLGGVVMTAGTARTPAESA